MAIVSFDSPKFDVGAEPENDINPIKGQSCLARFPHQPPAPSPYLWPIVESARTLVREPGLAWLRPKLEAAGYGVEGPNTEDWGWYLSVQGSSGRYILGAIAWPSSDGPVVDWRLQMWRQRSLRDRLRGRGHITLQDPLVETTARILRTEGEASELDVELEV
jgi:hypothetical protein